MLGRFRRRAGRGAAGGRRDRRRGAGVGRRRRAGRRRPQRAGAPQPRRRAHGGVRERRVGARAVDPARRAGRPPRRALPRRRSSSGCASRLPTTLPAPAAPPPAAAASAAPAGARGARPGDAAAAGVARPGGARSGRPGRRGVGGAQERARDPAKYLQIAGKNGAFRRSGLLDSRESSQRRNQISAPPDAPSVTTQYDAGDITVLEGLEAVRRRPGMYIGSTGPRGLHHLVYEVVDNSVDEALAGYCDRVEITLNPDGSCTVVRQRPRHPRRRDGRPGRPQRARGRDDRAPRRRQVRRRRLQGLRRPARRRHQRGQRAVGVARWSRSTATAGPSGMRFERGEPLGPIERLGDAADTGTTQHVPARTRTSSRSRTSTSRRWPSACARRPSSPRASHVRLDDRRGEGRDGRVPLRGRHPRLRQPPQRDRATRVHRDVVYLEVGGPGGQPRGRAAVDRGLQRGRLHLREQHQHPRGRHPPHRLPHLAHPHAERLRAREGPAEGEGRQPRGPGHPRGPHGDHLA